MRATYYGAIAEVDDQLGRLFAYLDSSGLAGSTLVVLTSDHGEMGGDHWLFEKLGYWDESFHIPLIVRDPDRSADPVGAVWSGRSPSRWTSCPPSAAGSGSRCRCRPTGFPSTRS